MRLFFIGVLANLKRDVLDDALADINKALEMKAEEKEYLALKALVLEYSDELNESRKILKAMQDKGIAYESEFQRLKTMNPKYYPSILEGLLSIAKEEKELFTNYEKWIKSLGAEFSKMKIKYIAEEYRGVTAGAEIEKGEVIISVPKHAIITLQMAKDTEIGKKMTEQKVSLIYPNNSTLSTYVLLEKSKPTTKWKPLFDAFPKKVDNFPVFFTQEELDLLKETQFLRILSLAFNVALIRELKDDMQKDYNRICKAAPEFEKIASLKDFMTTRCLVNSRIFGTKIDGIENDSIVPFAGTH